MVNPQSNSAKVYLRGDNFMPMIDEISIDLYCSMITEILRNHSEDEFLKKCNYTPNTSLTTVCLTGGEIIDTFGSALIFTCQKNAGGSVCAISRTENFAEKKRKEECMRYADEETKKQFKKQKGDPFGKAAEHDEVELPLRSQKEIIDSRQSALNSQTDKSKEALKESKKVNVSAEIAFQEYLKETEPSSFIAPTDYKIPEIGTEPLGELFSFVPLGGLLLPYEIYYYDFMVEPLCVQYT